MVQIGSVGGALLYVNMYLCAESVQCLIFNLTSAFILCDRIGRLWATRQLCAVWILGIVIFLTNNGRLGQVYAGRFIAGLGIGQTTVVAPVYISEIAPRSVRGLCTCVFAGSVYVGIMVSSPPQPVSYPHSDVQTVGILRVLGQLSSYTEILNQILGRPNLPPCHVCRHYPDSLLLQLRITTLPHQTRQGRTCHYQSLPRPPSPHR